MAFSIVTRVIRVISAIMHCSELSFICVVQENIKTSSENGEDIVVEDRITTKNGI